MSARAAGIKVYQSVTTTSIYMLLQEEPGSDFAQKIQD